MVKICKNSGPTWTVGTVYSVLCILCSALGLCTETVLGMYCVLHTGNVLCTLYLDSVNPTVVHRVSYHCSTSCTV